MQDTGGPDRFNHLSLPAFKQHCTEVTCLPCKPAVSMSQELRSHTNSQRLAWRSALLRIKCFVETRQVSCAYHATRSTQNSLIKQCLLSFVGVDSGVKFKPICDGLGSLKADVIAQKE